MEPDGGRDVADVVRLRLAEDHVGRFDVGDDEARVVERSGEPAFPDDEHLAVAFLRRKKARGGHGRSEDPARLDHQPDAAQAVGEVVLRILRVVRQDEKLEVSLFQQRDKRVRAGHQCLAPDQHTVHVDEIILFLPGHVGRSYCARCPGDKASRSRASA